MNIRTVLGLLLLLASCGALRAQPTLLRRSDAPLPPQERDSSVLREVAVVVNIPAARDASAQAKTPATAASFVVSASGTGAPWKPSGYSSAMNPVVSSPERKRGCCMIALTKSTLWPSPSISNASNAAICLSAAASRVSPQVTSLAIIGS